MSTATLEPATPTRPGWVRRQRAPLVVVAALAVAVVVVLLGPHRSGYTAALDPENPGPGGAQAVARVLAHDGVDVHVVRSADDLDATPIDASTTVVVTSTDQLGRSTAARLRAHVGTAPLVVVGPGYAALQALDIDAFGTAAGTGTIALDADCPGAFGGLLDGLRLEVDQATAYTSPGTTDGCFGGVVTRTDGVTLLGAADALTNDQVLRADDAALALRLLGQRPHLVWYVPTRADLVADDGVSIRSLLPDALLPSLAVVLLAVAALMLWRGRRLGALTTEPLPVVVRAIEVTRSRGRLYRRAGDRGHAAGVLRSAARARLADRLRLGARADEAAVLDAVARHLDRPTREVAAVLASDAPAPTSDHDLIRLADDLAALDREVRER